MLMDMQFKVGYLCLHLKEIVLLYESLSLAGIAANKGINPQEHPATLRQPIVHLQTWCTHKHMYSTWCVHVYQHGYMETYTTEIRLAQDLTNQITQVEVDNSI